MAKPCTINYTSPDGTEYQNLTEEEFFALLASGEFEKLVEAGMLPPIPPTATISGSDSTNENVRRMAQKFMDRGFEIPKALSEYKPVSEQDFRNQARAILDEVGLEGAVNVLLARQLQMDDMLKPALGGLLMTELNKLSAKAESRGDTAALELYAEMKVAIMNVILPASTKTAQTLNMYKLFYEGNPYQHVKEVQGALKMLNEGIRQSVFNLVGELNNINKEAAEEAVSKVFGTRVVNEKVEKAKRNYEKSKSELKNLWNNYKKTGIGVNPYEQAKQDAKFNAALARTAKDFIVYQSVKFEAFVKEIASNLGINESDIDEKHLKEIFNRVKEKEIGKKIKTSLKDMELKLKDIAVQHYSDINSVGQTLAEKIQDEFGLAEKDANEVAKAVQEEFKKLTAKAKIQAGKRSGLKVWKDIAELSDAGLLDAQDILDKLGKKLGIKELTPEIQSKLVELAKEINKLPEDAISDRARAMQAAEDYKYKVSKDLGVQDYIISNFLTNIFGSFGSNLINYTSNQLETFVILTDIAYTALKKGNFVDVMPALKAFLKGTKEGAVVMKEILKSGINPRKEIGNITPRNVFELIGIGDESMRSSIESFILGLTKGELGVGKYKITSKPISAVAKMGLAERRFWGRILSAADGFAGTTNYELASVMAAAEQADKLGLKGQERLDYLNNAVWGSQELMAEAEKAILDEGISRDSKKFNERVSDYIRNKRSEGIKERASEIAQRATLTQKPPQNTIIGAAANWVTNIAGRHPSMKFIFPAVNTIANFFIKQIERTPLEVGAIITDLVKDSTSRIDKPQEKITQEEYIRRIKSAAFGTAIATVLWALAGGWDDEEGEFEIYGGGSGDRDFDNYMRTKGWRPNSIRFSKDGGYYDYSYSPIALALQMVGNVRDFAKYDKGGVARLKDKVSKDLFKKPFDSLKEEQQAQVFERMMSGDYDYESVLQNRNRYMVTKAITTAPRMFLDYGFMSGFNGVIETLNEKGQGVTQKAIGTGSNILKGVTIPSYVVEIKKASDPSVYESKDFWTSYAKNVPFWEDANKVKLDGFGRPITLFDETGAGSKVKYFLTRKLYNPPRGTALDAFLIQNGIAITPPKNLDFIPELKFREFVVNQGQKSLEKLNKMYENGDFDKLSPAQVEDKVSETISEIRQKEKSKIMKELNRPYNKNK